MKKLIIKRKISRFWSVHTHSKFSAQDALPEVKEIVAQAKRLGYPALGLTDHGNMAGSVKLYTECMKAGIRPFPGTEFYVVKDRTDKKAKRYHCCIVAYTNEGYRNLVYLNTLAAKNFHNKPLLDLADMAQAAEDGKTKGLALTTGCFFGLPVQTLVTEGYEAAKQVVASYAQWFDTYVEMQSHGIDHDSEWSDLVIAQTMSEIAEDLSLPVIITQDSHYTLPEHKQIHESLKRMVAFGPDVDDAVFPGDGFHLADEAWIEDHFPPDLLEEGLWGLDQLYSKHTLTIPELDEYNYRVPFTVNEPEKALSERCTRELIKRGLWKPQYRARLNAEIEIVNHARMAGYLVMVSEITDFCTEQEIVYQCRGSAAGSLICWLLGITNVDPLKWGLMMERFLSKDRTKPPDVDLDVEHRRRQEVLDMLNERYTTHAIGTWAEMGLDKKGDDKGALMVAWASTMRKRGLEPSFANLTDAERAELTALDQMKVFKTYGKHPAGVVITTTPREFHALVPLQWIASSKQFVTQYEDKDVEALGLVKMDVLGLKTLSVLRVCLENMNRRYQDGLDFIPLTDSKTYSMVSKGDTAGVFQLEGGTAVRGVRELKPTKISDVIAAMALFRPATMKSGATEAYIARKHGLEKAPARHEIIAKHTSATHGILLYQEQVIAVLRDLGLDPDELTKFLKAVKASNGNIGDAAGVIREMLTDIKNRCSAAGMTDADVTWLEAALEAYAGYGFNSAHATVYGITAYRCAYLATHYPLEFHAALLAVAAGTDKESQYVTATRGRNIRVMRADINGSKATYAIDPTRRGIRRGFMSVKGVGRDAANELAKHQPYKNLDEVASRCDQGKVTGIINWRKFHQTEQLNGVLMKLLDAEALHSILEG